MCTATVIGIAVLFCYTHVYVAYMCVNVKHMKFFLLINYVKCDTLSQHNFDQMITFNRLPFCIGNQ